VADGGGLENRYGATHRGFESHALRQHQSPSLDIRALVGTPTGLDWVPLCLAATNWLRLVPSDACPG
jgi:hypothetical protein